LSSRNASRDRNVAADGAHHGLPQGVFGPEKRAEPIPARPVQPSWIVDRYPGQAHARPVQNGDLDYFGGEGLKEIYGFALLELGGQELLDNATDDARRSVDGTHSWSGVAPEPAARVAAYCEVLWARIGRARGTD
jgi:hypothetical protein